MSEQRTVSILPDSAAIARAAAEQLVELAQAAVGSHGRFSVALAGGSTPRAMYELLGQPPLSDRVQWERVHLFWSDERCVPPDDPESNFRMAREALLDHITIPAANIYPVSTVGGAAEATTEAYETTIRAFFQTHIPRFDLILLGMGPDGHTASLFPGAAEVIEPSGKLVVAVHNSPKPPPDRISFTLPLINAAAHVTVLAGGAEKALMLRTVLAPPTGTPLPAQAVRPSAGSLTWLIDQAV